MADAIIGSTVQVLLEKAISLATDRIGLVFGFNQDLEALRESASKIQAVLADAEKKQTENPLVQLWLQKVERVAFDADNVLDELSYESLRREVKSRNLGKVCLFISFSKHDISFRWRMASKIRDINDKLRNFIAEALTIGLMRMADSLLPTTTTNAAAEVATSRQTNSLVPQFVAGRAEEESEIVEILLGSSDPNVYVLPIVGMGGIGKTTLAKSVYNYQQIDIHFTKKIWICVSERFQVTELFRLILESLKGGKVEMSGQDAIVQEIRKALHGERFLLVLDDVWNENPKTWDDFYVSLVALSTTTGSCCLLTTRLRTTANLVANHDSYYSLRKLSDDDCWSVLTQKATIGGEMPEELNVHREQIVRICQGLPLAANAIGGLLRLQKREEWLSIVENKILKHSGDIQGDIMPILKLSFDYLPSPSIKKCFAYCSIFAKDTELYEDRLIELWMAEGFLQANIESGTMMEEIGGNYLRILVQSSLLEEVYGNFNKQCYQMHDLVHDLAESVSKTKRPEVENGAMENNYQVRYLVLDSFGEGKDKVFNATSPLVRTLFLNSGISDEMLLKFKYLHVLNLSGGNIEDLPSSIGKLRHLRYLDLSDSDIEKLPESLCKLYNLQTLRLYNCFLLKSLPRGMNHLISLRHLHYYCLRYEKFQMPPEMGRLTCLQTLEFFNIGKEKARGIEELGSMENLKGKLEIRNLDLVKGKEGAISAKLFGKQNLIRLELYWTFSMVRHDIDNCDDEHVLEGLEPHPNLQELVITNYMGGQFPGWLGNLSALVKLEFSNCESCLELPALGHLPCLEDLWFDGLSNVRCIGDSFYGFENCRAGGVAASIKKSFSALKTLHLSNMRNLSEWKEVKAVDDDVVFPKLEYLDIRDCCQLTTTPTHFPSLHKLVIWGDVHVLGVKSILSKSASALKSLWIDGMKGLTSLSDVVDLQRNHLMSLERLEIMNCDRLIDIPSEALESCTSLTLLEVSNCRNLVSFPLDLLQTPSLSTIDFRNCPKVFNTNDGPRGFQHLTNLRELQIGPFSDDSVELFDWSGLVTSSSSTLRSLYLKGKDGIQMLPNQLQHLTSLTYLNIWNYEFLEALPDWLGNLVSLEVLTLRDCPNLRYLPSVHAMGRLTKLRRLELYDCPLLKERCKPESGHDSEYSKISLLPNLRIVG